MTTEEKRIAKQRNNWIENNVRSTCEAWLKENEPELYRRIRREARNNAWQKFGGVRHPIRK